MCVCVHVCALSAHTRSDICSEPHSPDARDCLEIASMGSRCLCLQQGSGGDRQKRSRERVEVEGRKPPALFSQFAPSQCSATLWSMARLADSNACMQQRNRWHIWGMMEKRTGCGLGDSICCYPAPSFAHWWQKCS